MKIRIQNLVYDFSYDLIVSNEHVWFTSNYFDISLIDNSGGLPLQSLFRMLSYFQLFHYSVNYIYFSFT